MFSYPLEIPVLRQHINSCHILSAAYLKRYSKGSSYLLRLNTFIVSSKRSVSRGAALKTGSEKVGEKRAEKKRKNACGQTQPKVLLLTYGPPTETCNMTTGL